MSPHALSISYSVRPAITILFYLFMLHTNVVHGQSSVLASGDWWKLGTTSKGVFKLTKSDLESMGINTSTLDPTKIRIFGQGGGMLPQSNNVERPLGMPEKSIFVFGEADGSFDNGDYVLFYAKGPDQFDYDGLSGSISYSKNLYADTTYYFLGVGDEPGKRLTSATADQVSTEPVDTYRDFYVHEIDETNIINSGRSWVGESFSNTSNSLRSFELSTPDRVSGTIRVHSQVLSRSPSGAQFRVTVNSENFGTHEVSSYPDALYGDKGRYDFQLWEKADVSGGNDLRLDYSFSAASGGIGHLDYFILSYPRRLSAGSAPIFFTTDGNATGVISFAINDVTADHQLWNVSQINDPYLIDFQLSGGRATFAERRTPDHEYVMFDAEGLRSPILLGSVENQDLLSVTTPDGIIISAPQFLTEASRLADFRRSEDGLDVLVVTPEQVYNDFSSGRQDIGAIRDFVKYLYDKSPSKLRYLLLFGDGSFDYKNRSIVDHNFVPVYESRNSTHRIYSYSSDDFFGFLEEDEGEWEEDNNGLGGDHTLEIGIGRLPVKSRTEAEQVVNKLIRYQTSDNRLGDWRSKIYFLADDGDFNIHLNDAEGLASFMDTAYSYFDLNKIYVDAFKQEQSGGNEVVPEATRVLEGVFDEGALIVNFTGHGNEGQWTEEDLLVETMIPEFRNRVKLPLLVTATCEFGAYDNPLRLSGGEQMLLNPEGGAIALLTTTRPVFAHTNRPVNEAFYKNAFEPIDEVQPRLGDIIRKTKNNSLRGSVNRNFALLGDPMMRLAFPDYSIDLLLNENDTLKALGKYQFDGRVLNQDNSVNSGFNGVVTIGIFDKPIGERTLGDESQPTQFEVRNSSIFSGEATVTNGHFSFEFIVPKNISYKLGRAKVSMYARSDDGLSDANGAVTNIQIGGSADQLLQDDTPPEVDVFINSESFETGQTVGQNPLLLMRIFDDNGISLTRTGIGQQMNAVLDGEQPIELSDFYTSDIDTYKSGWIRYPLGSLSDGYHTITTKVWDSYNNATSTTVEFYIGGSTSIQVTELKSYPNPMQEHATFSFMHDRAGEGVEISFSIYSIGGELVYERQYKIDETDSVIDNIEWDGRYPNGTLVANGIYIYKIFVRSTADGTKSEAFEKLIIAN